MYKSLVLIRKFCPMLLLSFVFSWLGMENKIPPLTSNYILPLAEIFPWKKNCTEEMDVSMQSTCGQNVVEGLSGGGLEWWKLKLDKAIRISLIYSSFPFCSPLWFALSIVVDTRKNTNLFFFIPMLMFCLNGSHCTRKKTNPNFLS